VNLTLREACAQMILADYRFDQPDYDRAIAAAKEGVGGFCLFGGSIFETAPMVNSLQRHPKIPLLIASDYEIGAAHQVQGATHLPNNMAVAATRNPDLARLKGRITATEAAALGVRWVLAPVLDLNTNPENPIINVRSFGEDAALVSKMGRAFLEGLHEQNVLGCGKHFPGHGDVAIDSHLELPASRTTQIEPYRELASELDSIMTAHILYPALDPEHPASLSKSITEGLIRRDLRYDGLVVTDALMMGAITKAYPEADAVVLAAAAGADVVAYPNDPLAAVTTLEEAVKSGRLAEDRVRRSADRVVAAKRKLGLFENRKVDAAAVEKRVGIEAHREAARKIAEASIAHAKGDPVVPGNCFYVHVADPENVPGDLKVFEKHLSTGIGRMVVGIFFRQRAFSGKTGLPDALVRRVQASLKQDPEAVVVSFGSPYVIRQLPEAKHYVCAWSESEASQIAAAWAVQGKIPFLGKSPVHLGA
jgi:beta-glucosidase-like glycosyl hydrolase